MTTIDFYDASQEYGCFSNFYASPIQINQLEFPTTEHYYQWCKFNYPGCPAINLEYAELIRRQSTPFKAKILAHQDINYANSSYNWRQNLNRLITDYQNRGVVYCPFFESIKDNIMRKAVYQKFTQHSQLRDLLLSTGSAILREKTHRDSYWAIGKDGNGLNMLGQILMETRYLLRLQITTSANGIDNNSNSTSNSTNNSDLVEGKLVMIDQLTLPLDQLQRFRVLLIFTSALDTIPSLLELLQIQSVQSIDWSQSQVIICDRMNYHYSVVRYNDPKDDKSYQAIAEWLVTVLGLQKNVLIIGPNIHREKLKDQIYHKLYH